MADRPLLLFPIPGIADRTKKKPSFGSSGIHCPSQNSQGERLSPLFHELQTAFTQRNVEIQQTTVGIDPEQVIIIETVGSINEFVKAVQKIRGLEWLGELDVDAITPDENFYIEGDAGKILNGKLYLLMSNQRAMTELISLWQQYIANPNMQFQHGLTKFKHVFNYLKDIRRWGINERLIESGVIQYWEENLQIDPNRSIRFEIELWYRSLIGKRNEVQYTIGTLINELGGQIISSTCVEGICYHALLGELPANSIQNIIAHPDSEFVKCDGIMFLRPTGQFSSVVAEENVVEEIVGAGNKPFPAGNPVVALLDGVPLENHSLLSDRIIIDDPDNFSEAYRAIERDHGTAMASLIIHGDLNGSEQPLNSPIYLRPIMKPNPNDFRERRTEEMPNDILGVDLIHRAVKRIFQGENGEEAVAPSIKTINLSIGDRSRLFDQVMSPLGRLLDWLSFKYNVLFIVSAGNHTENIILDISNDEFNELSDSEVQEAIIRTLFQDSRNRRLLSPAESINALTVGALHHDTSIFQNLPEILDPFSDTYLPSPISAHGSGYRRAIKPDLIYSGGRQLYRKPLNGNDNFSLSPVFFNRAPGNNTAATDDTGDLNKTKFTRGTSNATALIARSSVICYDALHDIFSTQMLNIEGNLYIPVLLKAMLVHGCTWSESGDKIREVLGTQINDAYQIKSWISRWMGYGFPEISKVLDCSPQRATILGYGELLDGGAHIYQLPLPPSLSSQREWRRLTITLSWITPIFPNNQKYRGASLWFEANNGFIGVKREDADYNAVRRGTVQHEVFEGTEATPYVDGDNLAIKINCRADANTFVEPIRYGLAVSLEVKENVDIAIYEEIRTRIATEIQIQQRL